MLKKILTLATVAFVNTAFAATEMLYKDMGEDWTGTCATVS